MNQEIPIKVTYRFTCVGPTKEHKDEYLYLRDVVLPNTTDPEQAERIKIEMDAMLEHKWEATC